MTPKERRFKEKRYIDFIPNDFSATQLASLNSIRVRVRKGQAHGNPPDRVTTGTAHASEGNRQLIPDFIPNPGVTQIYKRVQERFLADKQLQSITEIPDTSTWVGTIGDTQFNIKRVASEEGVDFSILRSRHQVLEGNQAAWIPEEEMELNSNGSFASYRFQPIQTPHGFGYERVPVAEHSIRQPLFDKSKAIAFGKASASLTPYLTAPRQTSPQQ